MVLREHHGPSEGPVGGRPSLKLPFRIGRLRLGVEDAGPVCGRRVRLELRACASAGEALVRSCSSCPCLKCPSRSESRHQCSMRLWRAARLAEPRMWTAPGVVKKEPGTYTRQGVLLAQCGLLLLLMVMMS
jgi:hypothetical protein